VPLGAPHAIAVTHGHLDHARSAGQLGRRTGATVHASEAIQGHPSIRRAKRCSTLSPDRSVDIVGPFAQGALRLDPVVLPHDAPPTFAFRVEAEGRRAVVLTDMGRPCAEVAAKLAGAHVLVLESNHDEHMLENGPYPATLKRRIRGGRGHLSNRQTAEMLRLLAGPELHTVVLAHVSEHNNRPDIAESGAREELDRLGLSHVRVVVASQHAIGEEIAV
jgi:phosphoribosyl 1,2-cyclic phosphodiesterase